MVGFFAGKKIFVSTEGLSASELKQVTEFLRKGKICSVLIQFSFISFLLEEGEVISNKEQAAILVYKDFKNVSKNDPTTFRSQFFILNKIPN